MSPCDKHSINSLLLLLRTPSFLRIPSHGEITGKLYANVKNAVRKSVSHLWHRTTGKSQPSLVKSQHPPLLNLRLFSPQFIIQLSLKCLLTLLLTLSPVTVRTSHPLSVRRFQNRDVQLVGRQETQGQCVQHESEDLS